VDILNNSKYEVLTDVGFKDFKGLSIDYNTTITIKTNSFSLTCTNDHEIYYEKRKKKKAIEFIIGDNIVSSFGIEKIISIVSSNVVEKVYDLIDVEDVNSFYCNNLKVSNCLILDEFAHVENNIADDFYASTYPTISSGKTTKLIIISTPNKYNLFYKLWTDAENKRNSFNPVRVRWEEVEGRDEAWKLEQISNTSKEQFEQEHECSFDSASNGLIDSEKIKEMMANYLEPPYKDDDDSLCIYEKPKDYEKYIIVVDTAKGVEKDYSAFAVIKISKLPYEVVAVYRNNKISPLVYPDVLYKVGINYNEADMLIENNEYGQQITTILFFEKEYGNLIFTELTNKKQRIAYGNDGKAVAGVRTTAGIKNIGCSNLKAMIEHNKLIVRDYNTISELSTFIRVKDSYEADQGSHDDLVMCLVLFGWLSTQDYFKDIEQNVGEDIRSMHESDIDANMIGFGFMTNGKQSDDYYSDEEDTDHKDGWRPAGYEDNDEFEISIYY
jgi:hypothetical protein